ncbi:hypothetical protein DRO69_01435 [Candidatus Bathyarchaeota archaeon]|nr:MAG: hypothetical protein DRO69_01435 [Candidatus Bathyarchaeota archaeon]
MSVLAETSWKLTVIFVGFLVYSWIWIITNIPELFTLGVIYGFLMLSGMIISVFLISTNKPVFGFPPLRLMPETTIVGAFIGLLSVLISGAISQLPLFQVSIYMQLPPLIALFFAVLISCTEESFFRGALLPVVYYYGNENVIQAIIHNSILFTILHWVAYQASIPSLISSFIFSIIVSAASLHYKSGYVGMIAHVTYNLMILHSITGFP